MPNLSSYKKLLGMSGDTIGQVHKTESDMIMEATWDNDLESKLCYLYDYLHDDEPDKRYNLRPELSKTKIPIKAKFIQAEYNSLSKDQTPFHIQFKPSQVCNVPYYKDIFEEKYDATFPIGLYIDIPDEKKIYRKWLIVDNYTLYANQFPSFQVLPIDYKLQWVFKGRKYEMWCTLRSQSSYNSGTWRDYVFETTENQRKCTIPLNDITSTIFYNQRVIISAPIPEPLTWVCSKVENTSPNGINKLTFAQDHFDQHHDFIEKNESGKVIGMWADYYSENIPLQESNHPIPKIEKSEITYSGVKPEIKVGGSYKTFTMYYYDDNREIIDKGNYNWQFELNGKTFNESELLKVLYPDITNKLESNQIKIKFIGSDDYLNSILTIKNDTASLNVKIVGM